MLFFKFCIWTVHRGAESELHATYPLVRVILE